MIQYSVYSRPCVSLERMMKYYERVKSYAPTTGDVRLLFFTDRQWGMSKLVSRTPKEIEKIPEQIEFFDSLMKEESKFKVDEKDNNFLLF